MAIGGAWFDLGQIARLLRVDKLDVFTFEGDEAPRRGLHLGSWLACSPSGKIYAPFACSNVMGCPGCAGKGVVRPLRRSKRLARKYRFRGRLWERLAAKAKRRGTLGVRRVCSRFAELQALYAPAPCRQCAGIGSREAHCDEVWRERLEGDLERIGMYLCEEEGELYAIKAE